MKKVIDFPEEIPIKQQAADWLIKLDGDDDLTSEERESLSQWMNNSHVHRQQLFRLAELWNKMNVLSELAVPLDHQTERKVRWQSPTKMLAAAATILITMGVLYFNFGEPTANLNGFYATGVGQQSLVSLSDGSTVKLDTDSKIRVAYDEDFRDIFLLKGQAHFTVVENREIPFRVTAGVGRILALGTAFSVHIRGGLVDITVSEGSVSLEVISPAEASSEVVAAAGFTTAEQVVKELGTLRASQIATISSQVAESEQEDNLQNFDSLDPREMQRRLSWTEGVLIFSGEPLEEVVREISRYTMAKIEFADPEVSAIRIGGRFPVGETETMFETLENAFGLRVTYSSEDHILVSAGD